MTTEPLFKSAHDALVFAFNYSDQQYGKTPMSKVILAGTETGKGLSGNDGAAQAGMIKAEVKNIDRLMQAFLTARFAPFAIPCDCGCPCCSGRRSNEEWTNAIGVLSLHLKEVVLLGCSTTIDMRVGYLRKTLRIGKNLSFDELARKHHISESSIKRHMLKVRKFILGHFSNGVRHAGLGEKAMTAIADRLEQAGIVEAGS